MKITVIRLALTIVSIAAFQFTPAYAASTRTSGCGGHTYYVAKNGSDSNSGLRTGTPFLTIQHAANLVCPGDTVV